MISFLTFLYQKQKEYLKLFHGNRKGYQSGIPSLLEEIKIVAKLPTHEQAQEQLVAL